MRFHIPLLIILCFGLLGGSQTGKNVKPSEMDPNDLLEVRAFQDEFIQPMGKGRVVFLTQHHLYL